MFKNLICGFVVVLVVVIGFILNVFVVGVDVNVMIIGFVL